MKYLVLFLSMLLIDIGYAHALNYQFSGSASDPRAQYNVVAYGADPTGSVDSYTAIVAAQNAASANCGIVFYPSGTYLVLSTITPASCVTHRGVGYSLTTDSTYTLTGGTILRGNGSLPMFAFNNTSATCGNITSILATLRAGVAIEDLAVDLVTDGFHFGDFCNGGLTQARMKNLFVSHYSGWAYYWENGAQSYIENLRVGPATYPATGAMWFGCSHYYVSTGEHYNFGNMVIAGIDNASPQSSYGSRGVEFVSRNGASCNDWNVTHIHSLMNYTKQSQAGTFSGGSANITVLDGSIFPVGMPVTFEGGGCATNGFTQYRSYFVVSRIANVIQVSNFWDGTSLASASNAACNLVTYGWPALFIGGSNNTTPRVSDIQSSNFTGLDLEGRATALLVVQNSAVNIEVGYINGGQGTETACGIVVRSSTGVYTSAKDTCVDSSYNLGFFSYGTALRNETNPNVEWLGFVMINDGNYIKQLRGLDNISLNATTFANLGIPAPVDGFQRYCSDCTFANPCAGGGTGAIAKRLNGAWRCD